MNLTSVAVDVSSNNHFFHPNIGHILTEWRDIPGFPHYQVTDDGQVRSLDRAIPHGRYGTQHRKGEMLRGGINTQGRRQFSMRDTEGVKRHPQAHQLVMLAFVGPVPEGKEVCHNNGNPLDNRVENLRYDTRSGNMWDRLEHGTSPHQFFCRNGHERTPESTYEWAGGRVCWVCRKARWTKTNARIAEQRRQERLTDVT